MQQVFADLTRLLRGAELEATDKLSERERVWFFDRGFVHAQLRVLADVLRALARGPCGRTQHSYDCLGDLFRSERRFVRNFAAIT